MKRQILEITRDKNYQEVVFSEIATRISESADIEVSQENEYVIKESIEDCAIIEYLQQFQASYYNYFLSYLNYSQREHVSFRNEYINFLQIIPAECYLHEVAIYIKTKDLKRVLLNNSKINFYKKYLKKSYDIINNENSLYLEEYAAKRIVSEVLFRSVFSEPLYIDNHRRIVFDYKVLNIHDTHDVKDNKIYRDGYCIVLAIVTIPQISRQDNKEVAPHFLLQSVEDKSSNNHLSFKWLVAQFICYYNNYQVPKNKALFEHYLKYYINSWELPAGDYYIQHYWKTQSFDFVVENYNHYFSAKAFVKPHKIGNLFNSKNYIANSVRYDTIAIAQLTNNCVTNKQQFFEKLAEYIDNVLQLHTDDISNEGVRCGLITFEDRDLDALEKGMFFADLSDYFSLIDNDANEVYIANTIAEKEDKKRQGLCIHDCTTYYHRFFEDKLTNQFFLVSPRLDETSHDVYDDIYKISDLLETNNAE